MKTSTRTTYQCDYCKKIYFVKKACEIHELMCWSKPENYPACFHCKHYQPPYTERDGEFDWLIVYHTCKKRLVKGEPLEMSSMKMRVKAKNRNARLNVSEIPKPLMPYKCRYCEY